MEDIQTFQKLDTMQLAGWVVAAIKECRHGRMYIDEIGVGAGVVDRLREQGYSVRGINVARRARHEGLFTTPGPRATGGYASCSPPNKSRFPGTGS